MTSEQAEAAYSAIRDEYDRCVAIAHRRVPPPDLYGIENGEPTISYYKYRAEGLGYALDMMNAAKRNAPEIVGDLTQQREIS